PQQPMAAPRRTQLACTPPDPSPGLRPPSPAGGEGGLTFLLPSPLCGRGAGGEGALAADGRWRPQSLNANRTKSHRAETISAAPTSPVSAMTSAKSSCAWSSQKSPGTLWYPG